MLFKVVNDEAMPIEPTVNLVFDAGAGVTAPESKSLVLGTAVGTLPVPERSGFRFAGWTMNETPVTAETTFGEEYEGRTVTLVAVWIEQVTVTFNADGGTLPAGAAASVVIDKNGTLAEFPVPTKEGQNFVGWFNGTSQATLADTYAENIELVAHWEAKTEFSEITFAPDGGTIAATEGVTITGGVGSKQIESGTAIGTLPAASKEGYRFIGWAHPDGTVVSAETIISQANITLTAQWALQTVVTFVAEGGTLTGEATKTVDAGTAIGALPATTAPAGDELKGWFDEAGNAVTAESVLPATATAITLTAKFGWDGTTASVSLSGEGTEASPYLIASGADLKYFASNVTAGFYKVTKDIDLNDKAWTPIATFGGTFDGDGHKVTGLNVNSTTATAGLFSILSGATVKNLEVSGTATSIEAQIALLAGQAQESVLENIITRGTVSSNKSEAAGLLAWVNTVGNVTISNCTNYANVTTTATGTAAAAGILGDNQSSKITVTGCKNYGNITSGGNFVGGIIGLARTAADSTISGCYNYGDIRSTANSVSAGGIVGCNRLSITDSYCYEEALINGTAAKNQTTSSATGHYAISGQQTEKGGFTGCGLCNEDGTKTSDIADIVRS